MQDIVHLKICSGGKVRIGNGGSRGSFYTTQTVEDLEVPRELSESLKEHTSVHLILLISLHSISGLMDGM